MTKKSSKEFLYSLITLIGLIGIVACSESENMEKPVACPPGQSVLIPAELMETRVCYAMDDEDVRILKTAPGYFKNSYTEQMADSIAQSIHHTPMDYSNLRMFFTIRTSSEPLESWTNNEEKKGLEKYLDFENRVSQEVLASTNWYNWYRENTGRIKEQSLTIWPTYFTSRIDGEVSIEADRTLFGQEAGSNLSKHFGVETSNPCLPMGTFENFDFLFQCNTEEIPQAVPEYFAEDTWLQKTYVFRLRDIPEEKVDEVTFTISLPVICDYRRSSYLHNLTEPRTENRTLSASCTFHFGQVSDFEKNYSRYIAENDQLRW